MGSEAKHKILNRGRAADWQNWRPPDLSLQDVRKKFGGASVSDEELLLRLYAGPDAVNALATDGAPREYLNGAQPLVRLVEELTKKKDCHQVFIRRPGFSLALGKRAAQTPPLTRFATKDPIRHSRGSGNPG